MTENHYDLEYLRDLEDIMEQTLGGDWRAFEVSGGAIVLQKQTERNAPQVTLETKSPLEYKMTFRPYVSYGNKGRWTPATSASADDPEGLVEKECSRAAIAEARYASQEIDTEFLLSAIAAFPRRGQEILQRLVNLPTETLYTILRDLLLHLEDDVFYSLIRPD